MLHASMTSSYKSCKSSPRRLDHAQVHPQPSTASQVAAELQLPPRSGYRNTRNRSKPKTMLPVNLAYIQQILWPMTEVTHPGSREPRKHPLKVTICPNTADTVPPTHQKRLVVSTSLIPAKMQPDLSASCTCKTDPIQGLEFD